jgi:beta-N-acetylhexosaminidase
VPSAEPTTRSASTPIVTTTIEPTTTTTEPTTTTTTTEPTTTTDPILELVSAMSLEEKVGQLLMPVLPGTAADQVIDDAGSTPAGLIAELHLGGVIYLGPNIISIDQLTALSAGLQSEARSDSGIGLLIAVDQEGGRVMRVRDGVTPIPSARSLAGDAEAVRRAASTSGAELSRQGIDFVLAPVADLTDSMTNVIGDRSYGSDPELVAEMVTAAIAGYREAGVAMAVKHWPGHGATEVDSHRSLPVVERSFEDWSRLDRVPFVAAVEAGVDAVMVGHLSVPALDPSGEPATRSVLMVDGLLREGIGFDGVVMTDALDMGAVGDGSSAELAVQALTAGIDLLLAPVDVVAARDGVIGAIAEGRLTEERIDLSVSRLLRLKDRLGLVEPIDP